MADLTPLTEAIMAGNRDAAKAQTESGLDAGVAPELLLGAMVEGMDAIGERFKKNEIFVPEMLIAARAMKEALAILEPQLVAAGYKPVATAVIGTVQGDLHDIGKNLVAMMWKGASFEVVDLGTNVPPEKFIAAVKEHNAQVVGLSSLLTTTMPAMKATIEQIRADAEAAAVKVMVGGAPITQGFADEIGADGFSADAASAVDKARELLGVAAA